MKIFIIKKKCVMRFMINNNIVYYNAGNCEYIVCHLFFNININL